MIICPLLYKTANINGVNVFYREAGNGKNSYCFTTSWLSIFITFVPKFNEIADEYHIITPDYPGFGNSGEPSINE
jgi:pimeloyl-ACP methyl ester carboxylesterase